MRELIDSAAPAAFDLRSWIDRFDHEAQAVLGEPIRIDFDLPDGPTCVFGDPGELDRLFTSLVLDVSILMQPGGKLTVQVSPDELERLPDEEDVVDAARTLHLAIEDRGWQTVDTLFRALLDPLITVAPGLAGQTGALRWEGKIIFDENGDESRIIHLLLPYAAEKDLGH